MCKWRARDVAVLSLLETLGVNTTDTFDSSVKFLTILMHKGLCVGVPVDQVYAIEHINTNHMQSPVAAGYIENTILTGILNEADQAPLFVIDAVSLITTCPMSSLSLLEESVKKRANFPKKPSWLYSPVKLGL